MQLKAFVLDANLLQLREARELGIFSPLRATEALSALKICLKLTEVTEGRDYHVLRQKTSCLPRLNHFKCSPVHVKYCCFLSPCVWWTTECLPQILSHLSSSNLGRHRGRGGGRETGVNTYSQFTGKET